MNEELKNIIYDLARLKDRLWSISNQMNLANPEESMKLAFIVGRLESIVEDLNGFPAAQDVWWERIKQDIEKAEKE